jgi:hypothetical protein
MALLMLLTKKRDPDESAVCPNLRGARMTKRGLTMTIIKMGLGSPGGTVSSTSSCLNSSTALACTMSDVDVVFGADREVF